MAVLIARLLLHEEGGGGGAAAVVNDQLVAARAFPAISLIPFVRVAV